MLILPPGHYDQVSRPRVRRPRDRWIVGTAAVCLVILAVVLLISFTSHQKKSQHGCIDVSAATVIGGSELYRCGEGARELCTGRSDLKPQAYTNHAFTDALAVACRKAGLPVPPAAS